MIRRHWRDPNYRWTAVDGQGRARDGFTVADSEDELRERLTARAYTDIKIEKYDFAEWLTTADEALKALQRDGPPYAFDRTIWKQLKEHLFDLFEGKCAYCEHAPLAGQPGDVEHFRPKGRPTDDAGHPGYWWLAYAPVNLLPSCESCNRFEGKMSRFPIDGDRVYAPGALECESPRLVHPIDDDPSEHFEFLETGTVAPLTERGRASIEIYRLNRGGLANARLKALAGVERELAGRIFETGSISAAVDRSQEVYMREEYGAARAALLRAALLSIRDKL
jgi:uncharacterized protein (TIGR02646 family)